VISAASDINDGDTVTHDDEQMGMGKVPGIFHVRIQENSVPHRKHFVTTEGHTSMPVT
jgi:hypothetical protein